MEDSSSSDDEMAMMPFHILAERQYRPRRFREDISDLEYRQRHRVPRAVVDWLQRRIEGQLQHLTTKNQALSARDQILTFLHFIGTNSFYHVTRDAKGPGTMTICRAVHRVCEALITIKNEVINWPEDSERACQRFYQMAGFPYVCGCIDGTHVDLCPPKAVEGSYVNRHHKHSINVLAVAGPDLKFYYVNSNYTGRNHDAGVLRRTSLWNSFEEGFRPFPGAVILGDSAYPLREWLMTPFRGDPEGPRGRYNRAHMKTRNSVERSFGVLKQRFTALKSGLRVRDMVFTSKLVVAAVILHNLCIMHGDVIEAQEEAVMDAEEDIEDIPNRDPNLAINRQNQLLAYF